VTDVVGGQVDSIIIDLGSTRAQTPLGACARSASSRRRMQL
jgi:hypothetical protein